MLWMYTKIVHQNAEIYEGMHPAPKIYRNEGGLWICFLKLCILCHPHENMVGHTNSLTEHHGTDPDLSVMLEIFKTMIINIYEDLKSCLFNQPPA